MGQGGCLRPVSPYLKPLPFPEKLSDSFPTTRRPHFLIVLTPDSRQVSD